MGFKIVNSSDLLFCKIYLSILTRKCIKFFSYKLQLVRYIFLLIDLSVYAFFIFWKMFLKNPPDVLFGIYLGDLERLQTTPAANYADH